MGVIEPSSASEAVAEQVRTVSVYTPVFGVMDADTSKMGGVLIMLMVAESLMDEPSTSVKLTEHSMLSLGLAIVESS